MRWVVAVLCEQSEVCVPSSVFAILKTNSGLPAATRQEEQSVNQRHSIIQMNAPATSFSGGTVNGGQYHTCKDGTNDAFTDSPAAGLFVHPQSMPRFPCPQARQSLGGCRPRPALTTPHRATQNMNTMISVWSLQLPWHPIRVRQCLYFTKHRSSGVWEKLKNVHENNTLRLI